MMGGPSREGLDLHHQMCRHYFREQFKQGRWKHLWWWKMVWEDTRDRICS